MEKAIEKVYKRTEKMQIELFEGQLGYFGIKSIEIKKEKLICYEQVKMTIETNKGAKIIIEIPEYYKLKEIKNYIIRRLVNEVFKEVA